MVVKWLSLFFCDIHIYELFILCKHRELTIFGPFQFFRERVSACFTLFFTHFRYMTDFIDQILILRDPFNPDFHHLKSTAEAPGSLLIGKV